MEDKNNIEKLKDLIENVRITMLCTIHEDHIHSRPMATSQVDEQGNIWFFTDEFSGKANQIENNPKVCLAYSDPSSNTYISVRGEAEVVEDRTKMEELWNPIIKAWFPEGLDDPKLALLKVTAQEAEYWDSSSSKMVNLFGMIKAVVTGEKYEADKDEHGKISI